MRENRLKLQDLGEQGAVRATKKGGEERGRKRESGRLASETYPQCQRAMGSEGTFVHGCKHLPLKSLLVQIFATKLK